LGRKVDVVVVDEFGSKQKARMKTNLTFASMIAKFPQGIDIVRRINNDRGRAREAVEKLVFVASKVELKLVDHRSPFRSRHEEEDVNWVYRAW
jgi:hypothetical protein